MTYHQQHYQRHKDAYKQRAAKWARNNKERIRVNQQRLRQARKLEAFALLGNRCVRCSFDGPRALQLDHVNGDGWQDKPANRRRRMKGAVKSTYNKILRGEAAGLQLLCANCNWIKRFEKNEHSRPHFELA